MAVNQLNRAFARAAADTSESAAHAAVTISARMPVLMAGLIVPSAAGYAAWTEAYTEKVEAVWLGVMAASAAWGAAMAQAAFLPPTPMGLAEEVMRVATIAAKPSRRKAKANARRYARG
ncbi:hypothetical protein [Salinarimonas soli]|uniref:Uncharacterized protein n=1 Tax=Salinarimonas soli TaxID=1638099 RepID=A0A5B2VB26_9HYPH|nr:hypothetical protein [Salinarimonas soli]KAA2236231.1 hypothetical protein F0L46_16100 [Salinarimonas soli]